MKRSVNLLAKNTSSVKLVIFDGAGSLFDLGSRAPIIAYQKTFEQLGIPITAREASKPTGLAKGLHFQSIYNMPRINKLWRQKYGGPMTQGQFKTCMDIFMVKQKEALSQHHKAIEGAVDTLKWLKTMNIAVGMTTGYYREMMDHVHPSLVKQGIILDHIVTSDEVKRSRPWADMNLKVMELAGIANLATPAQLNKYAELDPAKNPDFPINYSCVDFGDTLVDKLSADNACIWSVVPASGVYLPVKSQEDFEQLPMRKQKILYNRAKAKIVPLKPHFIVNTVRDLPKVIRAINYLNEQNVRA